MPSTTTRINRAESSIKMMEECQAEIERLGLLEKITKLQRSLLVSAKANPLNPVAIKEAGLVYLYALELPTLALRYFQYCQQLDPQNLEYRKLGDRARESIQQQEIEGSQNPANVRATTRHLLHLGEQKLPQAATVIRKTGKLPSLSKATTAVQQRLAQDRKNRALDPRYEQETGDDLLAHSERALEQGDIDLADLLARHGLKRNGSAATTVDLLLQIGDAFFQKGEYASAQEAYGQARALDPTQMVAWFNEALAWQKMGGFEEALRCNTKACELDPENARILANFSTIQFELEQYDQAEENARRATTLQPDYARAWDNLAGAQAAQHKYGEAITSCQKALELRPEFPELWFKLGVLLFNEGRLEESRQAFLKSREFESGASYASSYLVLILVREGKLAEAVATCEEAERQQQNLPLAWLAWNNIALAYVERGEHERATWAGRLATRHGRSVFDAWFNLAYTYHLSGQFTDAQDAYEQALSLSPLASHAWHNLGLVCRELHELRRSTQAFQKVVEIEPTNADAWTELATSWEREGDQTQAGIARDHALELLRAQKPETEETAAPAAENRRILTQIKSVFKK